MSVSLTFTTLGELIKGKRVGIGISLSELGRMTGISKGVLSKIESGETKRPEIRTLKPIADVLEIPYEEIIEWYIEVEHRIEVFDDFLSLCIEVSNTSLMIKVAMKFLENSKEETHILLEHIYRLASSGTNNEMKLALFNTIISYSRVHGIPHFIAKSSLQKYLIERQDFKSMEESFKVGEEAIHYVDFLTEEDKIILYFKMALQAYAIKKYEQCVEMGKKGIAEDVTNNELKERVALAICNSYICLNDCESAENYVNHFCKLGYKFVLECNKTIKANIHLKRGEYELAIPLLQECLLEATDDNYIHRLNDLLETLLILKDDDSIVSVLDSIEERKMNIDVRTPYRYRELGRFYKIRGDFNIKQGNIEMGISNLFESVLNYEKVNAYIEINRCIGAILNCVNKNYKKLEKRILGKLVYIYNEINQINR
ncbi:helix-turn-helix domain-containing protein [Brevibacillus laterosporus]|uniref:helix-turn-helix domain-containing protein n=1 Tax=Brevibacillus laterosporus TaxID=1465 RepID=UPI000E6B4F17|nr:helix-turn-helix transcriptional regulator [Brevibacillus laterosporus]AYB37501.1 XRE family transcriptional regulator [Brevibacillus laterosporus]MBM7111531.1 Helix-turn-helix domain protein [Brevibacillus laterosporus]